MSIDREFLVRLFLATLIVVPPVFVFQRAAATDARSARAEQALGALAADQRLIAQDRVDRALDACRAFNDQRSAMIATTEALVRVAAETPPDLFTDRDRLLLGAFMDRAHGAVESASRPRTCTVESLHLEDLASLARGR